LLKVGSSAATCQGARHHGDAAQIQREGNQLDDPRDRASAISARSLNRNPYAGDPDFMASLARGLQVLRAFNASPDGVTIAQLSSRTGIPRAAVRRCLYTLGELGYVTNQLRSFSLTPKMLMLGHAYLSSAPLVVKAQPMLDDVCHLLQESCSISILDGPDIVYVARAASRRILSVALHVGSRLPAYCTAMGQVLLANLPEPALEQYCRETAFVAHTGQTLTDANQLRRRLDTVRRDEYALVDEELEVGLRSVAVAIRDSQGDVVAAMNTSAQSARVPAQELRERFLPVLRVKAAELSTMLRD
jgi:IclR family transcriptional regulator, pca regulon regulatory protein